MLTATLSSTPLPVAAASITFRYISRYPDRRCTTWKSTLTIFQWRLTRWSVSLTVSFLSGVLRCPNTIVHLPHIPAGAFAAKHMPDLGHVVREFQVAHWKLQDWRKLDKKLYGPEFDCGGHKWCVISGYYLPVRA